MLLGVTQLLFAEFNFVKSAGSTCKRVSGWVGFSLVLFSYTVYLLVLHTLSPITLHVFIYFF